jgi:hypothetical protein
MKKAVMVLAALLFGASLYAQDAEPAAEPQAEPELSALATKTQEIAGVNYSIGIGALLTDGVNDQFQAPFLAAHLHGFEIPEVPPALEVETGAIIEIGKDTLNPTLDDVNVRIWSSQRMTVGNVLTGADLKVLDSGDYQFDARVVAGYAFNVNFSAEVYLFEDNRPISAAFFYRF